MKYRLREVINNLDHDELRKIKRDLEAGGHHLHKFISERIRENEKEHDKICAVCNASINPNGETYTILFGPKDFLKKASFCGVDCLTYFTHQLEEQKRF